MSTFIEILDSIQAMAYGLTRQWGNRFSVDELVNEAWIRSLRQNFYDAPLIMRRAKLNMIDYAREQIGRNYFYRYGEKITRVKLIPKHITNVDSDECNSGSVLDGKYEDKNLLRLENCEILTQLIFNESNQKYLDSIMLYYFEEKTFKEIAVIRNRSTYYIHNLVHKGIEKYQEELQQMDLMTV